MVFSNLVHALLIIFFCASRVFSKNERLFIEKQRQITKLIKFDQHLQDDILIDLNSFVKIQDLAKTDTRYSCIWENITEYYNHYYPDTYASGRKITPDILVLESDTFMLYNGEILQVIDKKHNRMNETGSLALKFKRAMTDTQKSGITKLFTSSFQSLDYSEGAKIQPYNNNFYFFETLNPDSFYKNFQEFEVLSVNKIPKVTSFPCRENKILNRVVFLHEEVIQNESLKSLETPQGNEDLKSFLKKFEKVQDIQVSVIGKLGSFCEVPSNDVGHIEFRVVDHEVEYRKRKLMKPQSLPVTFPIFGTKSSDIRKAVFPGRGKLFCVLNSTCPVGVKEIHYDMENLDKAAEESKSNQISSINIPSQSPLSPTMERAKRPALEDDEDVKVSDGLGVKLSG